MIIKDAYINEPFEIGSDIYYKLDKEDEFNPDANYSHIGLLSDFYTDGERYIAIMYDDEAELMYSVLEYNKGMKMIASESFKFYKEAKRFFKEIL